MWKIDIKLCIPFASSRPQTQRWKIYSFPTLGVPQIGLRPAPNLRYWQKVEMDCSKQKEKKKNGIEVRRGNRLKKEKSWKELEALTQSSLAFNPCVCMNIVGEGGEEKKVKVDSVFRLWPAGVAPKRCDASFFKITGLFRCWLMCFCKNMGEKTEMGQSGQESNQITTNVPKRVQTPLVVCIKMCFWMCGWVGSNVCKGIASAKGSACGDQDTWVCSLMSPCSYRLNPPYMCPALPFCRSLRC